MPAVRNRKRSRFPPFLIPKVVPRQARDKHRESTQNDCRFLRCASSPIAQRAAKWASEGTGCGKRLFIAPFSLHKYGRFAKTGSGQTYETLRGNGAVCLLQVDSRLSECGAKNAIFFGVFPMFVPSLSWQNDRFSIKIAQKWRLDIQ
jgi:hypothetical protein